MMGLEVQARNTCVKLGDSRLDAKSSIFMEILMGGKLCKLFLRQFTWLALVTTWFSQLFVHNSLQPPLIHAQIPSDASE
jgi:hypothetical protein